MSMLLLRIKSLSTITFDLARTFFYNTKYFFSHQLLYNRVLNIWTRWTHFPRETWIFYSVVERYRIINNKILVFHGAQNVRQKTFFLQEVDLVKIMKFMNVYSCAKKIVLSANIQTNLTALLLAAHIIIYPL